ncbi:MAG TPA: type VI secretion system baseplate subunit TssE [Limnobacter sp.]|nr:type VI secretion system baseplate subunit TssE [Limnobacter sp.]
MSKLHDALQPALLDRLQDDERSRPTESPGRHTCTPEVLRMMVVRDLEHLLNSNCILDKAVLDNMPALRQSVLAYGMPPLAGQSASHVNIRQFEQQVADLVRRFEPRIDPKTLRVQAESRQDTLHLHNVIGLRISGLLWARPSPVELLLRQEIDLETGRVALSPLGGISA